MILDYSEKIEVENHERQLATPVGVRPPEQRDLFYAKRGVCPICCTLTSVVHAEGRDEQGTPVDPYQAHHDADRGNAIKVSKAWSCSQCGWWEVENEVWYEVLDWAREYYLAGHRTALTHGILRAFEICSNAVPVDTLRKYIAKNPDHITNISYRKMEELVKSVFREHYDCEVRHCGKSHDGGIDLVVIQSNAPIAVQVKRRLDQTKTESVALVRELLGASLLAGYKHACFVTTASTFSSPAKQAATQAIRKELVNTFELIDGDMFIEMLRLTTEVTTEHWMKYTWV